MKTDFRIIAMIALVMVGFFSCKKQKEEVKPEQKPKEQLYALKIDVVEADKSLEKITYEKGIIVGTKEDFKRMSKDKGKDAKGMSMKMVGPHNHVFWPNSTGPVSTEKRCLQQIYQIKLQHWNQWKAEANEKCKPIVKVVHCPLAATYDYGPFDWDHKSFTIYPDISACGPIPLYETTVRFPFIINDEGNSSDNDGDSGYEGFDFDSEKVAQFIEKL